MLKCIFVAAAGGFAVAVLATAATGPEAMAAAPKCLNKANKYVACTDKLKTKSSRRSPDDIVPWNFYHNSDRPSVSKSRAAR